MGGLKSYLSLISLLALFSCSKEITRQNNESVDEIFTELGSDAPYLYGETYYGRKSYVTYYPGNIPVILSIPHGGDISPSEIGNRTYGVSVTDSNTIELGIAIRNYFYSNYNIRPYVIINNLKRTKLDANREINEAAQGNIFAERAFDEFHFYINSAREEIISKYSTGFLFDIHGHGVNPDGFYDMRTWIGYLLSADQLDNSDSYIDQNISIDNTSIYNIANSSTETLSEILRGPNSLGSFFENNLYTALPSSNSPSPEGMRYFSGGFNTSLYGKDRNFNFNAIQLEFPFPDLRDTPESRNSFASAFVNLVQKYIQIHTGIDIFKTD
tara:strand:+ start:171 stop:1151 length:981 start_codon:yes stop_codon:yes gene_type:complete